MSQYRTGTAAVTNNSAVVTGNGTEWLTRVEVDDLFNILGSSAVYGVASIESDTSLTLDRVYTGSAEVGVDYTITRDFTPRHNLPYPSAGDDLSAVMGRAIRLLDALIPAAGAGATPAVSMGSPGETVRPYFAWARTILGVGFSLSPSSQAGYLGVTVSSSIIAPTDPAVYQWVRIANITNEGDVSVAAGATTFVALTDTPAALVANKYLKVNGAGDSFELVDLEAGKSSFVALTDTPIAIGAPGQFVRVAEDGVLLEYADDPTANFLPLNEGLSEETTRMGQDIAPTSSFVSSIRLPFPSKWLELWDSEGRGISISGSVRLSRAEADPGVPHEGTFTAEIRIYVITVSDGEARVKTDSAIQLVPTLNEYTFEFETSVENSIVAVEARITYTLGEGDVVRHTWNERLAYNITATRTMESLSNVENNLPAAGQILAWDIGIQQYRHIDPPSGAGGGNGKLLLVERGRAATADITAAHTATATGITGLPETGELRFHFGATFFEASHLSFRAERWAALDPSVAGDTTSFTGSFISIGTYRIGSQTALNTVAVGRTATGELLIASSGLLDPTPLIVYEVVAEGGGGSAPDASTTAKGIIEIATDAEAAAGVAPDKALTPKGYAAAEAARGAIPAAFVDLTDTPSELIAAKILRANAAGDALEFVDPPAAMAGEATGGYALGQPVLRGTHDPANSGASNSANYTTIIGWSDDEWLIIRFGAVGTTSLASSASSENFWVRVADILALPSASTSTLDLTAPGKNGEFIGRTPNYQSIGIGRQEGLDTGTGVPQAIVFSIGAANIIVEPFIVYGVPKIQVGGDGASIDYDAALADQKQEIKFAVQQSDHTNDDYVVHVTSLGSGQTLAVGFDSLPNPDQGAVNPALSGLRHILWHGPESFLIELRNKYQLSISFNALRHNTVVGFIINDVVLPATYDGHVGINEFYHTTEDYAAHWPLGANNFNLLLSDGTHLRGDGSPVKTNKILDYVRTREWLDIDKLEESIAQQRSAQVVAGGFTSGSLTRWDGLIYKLRLSTDPVALAPGSPTFDGTDVGGVPGWTSLYPPVAGGFDVDVCGLHAHAIFDDIEGVYTWFITAGIPHQASNTPLAIRYGRDLEDFSEWTVVRCRIRFMRRNGMTKTSDGARHSMSWSVRFTR